jgi:hypothetical protein
MEKPTKQTEIKEVNTKESENKSKKEGKTKKLVKVKSKFIPELNYLSTILRILTSVLDGGEWSDSHFTPEETAPQ